MLSGCKFNSTIRKILKYSLHLDDVQTHDNIHILDVTNLHKYYFFRLVHTSLDSTVASVTER